MTRDSAIQPTASATPRFEDATAPLCALLSAVDPVELRAYEGLPPDTLRQGIALQVQRWLEHAIDIAQGVADACDTDELRALDHAEVLALDASRASRPDEDARRQRAADTAFAVRLDLAQRWEALSTLSSTANGDEILMRCESAVRRMKLSLSALERAVAEAAERAPRVTQEAQLAASLRVRSAYAAFRAGVLGLNEQGSTTHKRLRAVGIALAVLVGSDTYKDLRLVDRLQVASLQRRVLAWLRQPEPRDELAGVRLWQDAGAFARMLAAVNQREELVRHDAQLLPSLSRHIAQNGVDAHALRELRALHGKDDELDRCLLAPRHDTPALLAALGRLRGDRACEPTEMMRHGT